MFAKIQDRLVWPEANPKEGGGGCNMISQHVEYIHKNSCSDGLGFMMREGYCPSSQMKNIHLKIKFFMKEKVIRVLKEKKKQTVRLDIIKWD